MLNLYKGQVLWLNRSEIIPDCVYQADIYRQKTGKVLNKEELIQNTISHKILESHHQGCAGGAILRIKFDAITSHDITFVGIIQTARASGMKNFPLPYVLTNCHNSLCAVGGTINEDDHIFGLTAARKYGGIYVPANIAVIHSYNREKMAGCGKMILGSDSHTRYGALGTIAIGEGGGELAKQLLGQTYDLIRPSVVGIVLKGKPSPFVGPQDVALSIIKAVYESGFTKNKIMEFIGDGVHTLPVEYRNGIDVMTTETTCLSSIWRTDELVREYLTELGRECDYEELKESEAVIYDGILEVDLTRIKPSIALPFHPSNVYTIEELKKNPGEIFEHVENVSQQLFENTAVKVDLQSKIRKGKIYAEQGIIVGCSGGTFDNIVAAAEIVKNNSIGSGEFQMTVYPGSQPTYLELIKNGSIANLMEAGVVIKPAFCGPCFGAGDTPAHGTLSLRHATRNFPNRDGSKPGEGQMSMVALMDARSIAATAIHQGELTGADEISLDIKTKIFHFDNTIYAKRVLDCYGNSDSNADLILGPNIKDWPVMPEMTENMLFKVVSYITDPVTTTDELIPSGETSSYRSNPIRLAEYTLSRKDPDYVPQAKAVLLDEQKREEGMIPDLDQVYAWIRKIPGFDQFNPLAVGYGSAIFANRPGDGSAREQAASCQRVLGGWANFALEYATKRYRSNLLNWGLAPFLISEPQKMQRGSYVFVPNLKKQILDGTEVICGYVLDDDLVQIELRLGELTEEERHILTEGCLINYNRNRSEE